MWCVYVYMECFIYVYTLQHTATHCNTLQHTATHCNTLMWYVYVYMECGSTANPTWVDIFERSKLKARTSLLPRFSVKRRSNFELWALQLHSKMSPQVGWAVYGYRGFPFLWMWKRGTADVYRMWYVYRECVMCMCTKNVEVYVYRECGMCMCTWNVVYTCTHCNTLQHTATHCNTLQHTATHSCGICMCTKNVDMYVYTECGMRWLRLVGSFKL